MRTSPGGYCYTLNGNTVGSLPLLLCHEPLHCRPPSLNCIHRMPQTKISKLCALSYPSRLSLLHCAACNFSVLKDPPYPRYTEPAASSNACRDNDVPKKVHKGEPDAADKETAEASTALPQPETLRSLRYCMLQQIYLLLQTFRVSARARCRPKGLPLRQRRLPRGPQQKRRIHQTPAYGIMQIKAHKECVQTPQRPTSILFCAVHTDAMFIKKDNKYEYAPSSVPHFFPLRRRHSRNKAATVVGASAGPEIRLEQEKGPWRTTTESF